MVLKKTFICPYCFNKHEITKVQFRCTNKKCSDFDDIETTIYEKGNPSTPKKGKKTFEVHPKNRFEEASFLFTSNVPKYGNCPECGHKTFKKICPSCHNRLPEATLTGRDMIISVVGSRGSGKSHFVGVIIKELIDRISVSFGGSMEPEEDSWERYEEHFGRRLYTDLQKLDLTSSSEVNVDNGAYKPLIFRLNFPRKSLNSFSQNKIDSFTFVFFDTAGEDLNSEDVMNTYNKYIFNSSGIIFLLDPMQIPAVRNKLDSEIIERASSAGFSQSAPPVDITARVSRLIRKNNGLPPDQKIDIPVAVVFSKLDAIYSIIPEGSTLLETSPHCANKTFVLADGYNVNLEVQGLLKEWGLGASITQIENNYKDSSFFTLSSLGLNNIPQRDNSIERPRPHRIEDPLLWMLMKNNVIKKSK